jgi:hypothetical protein
VNRGQRREKRRRLEGTKQMRSISTGKSKALRANEARPSGALNRFHLLLNTQAVTDGVWLREGWASVRLSEAWSGMDACPRPRGGLRLTPGEARRANRGLVSRLHLPSGACPKLTGVRVDQEQTTGKIKRCGMQPVSLFYFPSWHCRIFPWQPLSSLHELDIYGKGVWPVFLAFGPWGSTSSPDL